MPTSAQALVIVAALAQAAAGQTKDSGSPDADGKHRAAERLELMKTSVRVYELALTDGSEGSSERPPRKATLEAEPLLRWSDIHGDNDGTLFLWTDAGRPVAIAQAFSVDKGTRWLHEFQSLSVERFSLERGGHPVWTPAQAGLEFKALADAPVPAKTATQRLAQMHAMSRRFAASDDYGNGGDVWQLRLLTRPVYRYPSEPDGGSAETLAPRDDWIDGAVFAYVVGTDPEMLLLLEARGDASQSAWHYALAPMTSFALTATLDDNPVWSCPFRGAPFRRQDTLFTLDYKP